MKAFGSVKMAASSSALHGVFAVNKPIGMSSAQAIRDCQHHFNPSNLFKPMIEQEMAVRAQESNTKRKRRGFSKKNLRVKMGHGGTLDPLATGVLILGVGKGTKSLQSFLLCTKTYETVVLFGANTDTYDRVGKILGKKPYEHITRPMVEEALTSFRGKFQQMPPLYSALKMEGKPLYEYAREGKPIPREISTREVDVSELELVEWYEPGEHTHRWPADKATDFERRFAEQVWAIEKQQMASPKLTPEEEEEEIKALKEHENFKRKADESVDALVYDHDSNKRRRKVSNEPPSRKPPAMFSKNPPLMSGALGPLPPPPPKPGRGSNLIPEASASDSSSPWEGKGPPAAKIRMTVTTGFYVRSFCHDLGVKVGSAAMMAELCRTRQSDFFVGSDNCLEFSDLAKGESVWAPQVKDMLSQWNHRPPDAPSHTIRTRQDQPAGEDENTAQDASPTKSKEFHDAVTSQGKYSNKKPALPTPQPSSPVRASKSKESASSKIEEAEVLKSEQPKGNDDPADASQALTTPTLPASREIPKSSIENKAEDEAKEVYEEPLGASSDTLAASKA
ncbi:trub family pseudouridylate synthase-containing protein [Hypoxylon sp. NC1633]|nr:trub family pseudouridylate synthase-containing protein [Hypoxylon sp. NC1633]